MTKVSKVNSGARAHTIKGNGAEDKWWGRGVRLCTENIAKGKSGNKKR